MDERSKFLPSNQKRNKKKLYSNNRKIKRGTINIPNITYIIIFILLIMTCILLLLRIIKLNMEIEEYNIPEDNLSKNATLLKKSQKLKRLFQYKEDSLDNITDKNQIHISMSIDNNYTYPTLVSMTSILENNNETNNLIIFHLFLSYNYNTEFIEIFESLKNKYEVKINYYIIPDIFMGFRTWSDRTDCIYYKILIPLILKDIERVIYLDADTLTFKDLYELYSLPFNDNYVLGYPFQDVYKIDKFVENATTYINGGVLLLNNEKIRNNNKDVELLQFTLENNANLWFLEQDSLNIVFFNKVGILPLKYGIYLYGDINTFENHYEKRLRITINKTELNNAIEDPSIVHLSCCNPKVWNKISNNDFGYVSICDRFRKEFYYYANKTDYYSEIYNKYMN